MTEPSEQLDERLENWRAGQFDQQIRFGSRLPSLPPSDGVSRRARASSGPGEGDDEIHELLETAQRIEVLPTLRPSAEFSRQLEQRLRVRAAALRATRRRRAPLLVMPGWLRVHRGLATLAAVLVTFCLLGVVGLVGAEASNPGSPFYGVKLFEQSIRLTFSSPADRVRLHISYAQDVLNQLQQPGVMGNENVYLQTLNYLDQETGAASSELANLPGGSDRDQLTEALAQLVASEQQTLHGLLLHLSFTERLATTTELGKLGAPIPLIRSITVTFTDDGRANVVIDGSGFEPGAVLLLDGQSVPATLEITPDEITAMLALSADMRPSTLGVSNPDGTVAQDNHIAWTNATPTPEPTKQPTGEPTHKPGEPTPTPGGGDHRTPTPEPHPSDTPNP
jgi:hypothetical protein